MEPTPQERLAPPPASSSLHELLGRNLATYQAIELVIKSITGGLRVQGVLSTLPAAVEAAKEKIRTKTMGSVLEDYLAIYDDRPCEPPDSHPGEVWIGIKVSMGASPEEVEAERSLLKQLVQERNWLVHHSLMELQAGNDAIRQEAWHRLETQHREAQDLLRSLRDKAQMLDEIKSTLIKDHLREELDHLRLNALVIQLLDEHRTIKLQPDGFFLLQRFKDLVRARLGATPDRFRQAGGLESLLQELRPGIRFEERGENEHKRVFAILPGDLNPSG